MCLLLPSKYRVFIDNLFYFKEAPKLLLLSIFTMIYKVTSSEIGQAEIRLIR
jgi:hypothetical protein